MKIKQIFGGLVILALITPLFFAFGAIIKTGEDYSLGAEDVVRDNLYVVAGDVSVGGLVFGDLLIAGGSVVVSERVSDDLMVLGGSITILESVGGDVRIIGGNIIISEDVGGDIMIAGGSVKILSGVVVGGDVVVAGGKVTLNGVIRGDVKMVGNFLTINGQVDGDVKSDVGKKIKIGEGALIKGNLIYGGDNESVLVVSAEASILGETTYKENGVFYPFNRKDTENSFIVFLGTIALFKILSFLVIALIGVLIFKKFTKSVVENITKNPWKELLKGLIVLILIPIIVGALFATLIGSVLGVLLILVYVAMIIVSAVYAGITFGVLLHMKLQKREELIINWKNAIGGVILLAIISFIPVIGWLASLAFFLFAFGSISDLIYRKLWLGR